MDTYRLRRFTILTNFSARPVYHFYQFYHFRALAGFTKFTILTSFVGLPGLQFLETLPFSRRPYRRFHFTTLAFIPALPCYLHYRIRRFTGRDIPRDAYRHSALRWPAVGWPTGSGSLRVGSAQLGILRMWYTFATGWVFVAGWALIIFTGLGVPGRYSTIRYYSTRCGNSTQ